MSFLLVALAVSFSPRGAFANEWLGTPTAAAAPFPGAPAHLSEAPAGTLNVVVFGDSLGNGLHAGLYRALKSEGRFNVVKKSRVSTGFVRNDYYDWNEAVREIVSSMRVDIAVVMIGTNDRQTIVEGGTHHPLRSDGWTRIYSARVDDFTKVLKDAGATVYWVGLPVMKSERFGSDMRHFNAIYERRAEANGVTFIPTWNRMAVNGGYSAYGPDVLGRNRLLRADDGIHMTTRGYVKMASFVEEAFDAAPAAAPATALASSEAAAQPEKTAGVPAASSSAQLERVATLPAISAPLPSPEKPIYVAAYDERAAKRSQAGAGLRSQIYDEPADKAETKSFWDWFSR